MNKIKYMSVLLLTAGVTSGLYCMSDDIKMAIDRANIDLSKELGAATPRSLEEAEAHWRYNEEVANIVRFAGSQMNDDEKLKHLHGDSRWDHRKAIIEVMINQGRNPNSISYSARTPLKESVVYEDKDFTKFLLKNGARPNAEILQIRTSEAITKLLVSQKYIN